MTQLSERRLRRARSLELVVLSCLTPRAIRPTFAIATIVLAAACASAGGGARPSSVGPERAVAVSSLRSVYGIQLDAAGTVSRRDDWLYVVVPTGSVRTYQGTAPAWDLMLSVGLATCTAPRRSDVVAQSVPIRVAPAIGFTRDSSLLDTTRREFRDTLRFTVGVPPGTKLDRSWLTFELSWPIESTVATYSLDDRTTLGDAASSARPSCRGAEPQMIRRSGPATPRP